MSLRSPLCRAAVCAAVAGTLVSVSAGRAPQTAAPPRPRLLVVVVFDQLRGDYIARWKDLFEDVGFNRLTRDGTWFTDCHYPYAGTMTGPGHASLLTGCSPDRHGIVLNDWYDRAVAGTVYCAAEERYRDVFSDPPPPEPQKKDDDKDKDMTEPKRPRGSGSPGRLLVPTFADVLKERTAGRGKVVGVSLKDRSALLPVGKSPDACYWFSSRAGQFITSTYYRDVTHAWVAEFNRSRHADRWFGQKWDRLRRDVDYSGRAGPDDAAGEGLGIVKNQGRVFPHPMNAKLTAPGKDYYDTLNTSPFGNELLLDFALRAIDAEGLGQDDVPDLLNISFSSNDLVGHQYGPDSHEVLDVTLRSDQIMRDLLAGLDRKVGRGNYLLALTADHGICPLPEQSARAGHDARRLDPKKFRDAATDFLSRRFGSPEVKSAWIEHEILPWLYLNEKLLAARCLASVNIATALAEWASQQPGVQAAYTRTQLEGDPALLDEVGRRLRKSYHPARCGDVAVISKPLFLFTKELTGTTHGTPHSYDTHVPLLVYGPGVPGGASNETVTPQAIAAIFAQAVGMPLPAAAEAPVPRLLLRP